MMKESKMIDADECEEYLENVVYYFLSKLLDGQQDAEKLMDIYLDEALSHSEFEYDVDYTKDDLEEIGADIADWILDCIEEE